jgi:hypothetical protein
MPLYVSPVAPERPCIDDGGVTRRSRTLRVRSTPRALPTAPPRSELGFNLSRSAALDADATSAQEHF